MQTKETIEEILQTVSIPTLPTVVARIGALLDDPDSGIPEIAEVVLEDPAIAAKVLRMANSAWYGQSEEVVSIPRAAAVLGARVLRNIALQASVIQRYEHLTISEDFDPREVWKHAISTAVVSKALAQRCRSALPLEPDEFYTCGLLHDIGKMIMVDSLGDDYLTAMRDARALRRPTHLVEEKTFSYNHADVGAMVAAMWKLPRALIGAIRFHHGPPARVHQNPAVLLVTCGDRIANAARRGGEADPDELVNLATRHRVGLALEDVRDALESATESWATIQI